MDDYHLSLEGLKQFKVAARSLHSDEKYFLSNGYIKMGNYWMMISVNRNVENPVATAGLGDAFTATTFLADLSVKCSNNSNSI